MDKIAKELFKEIEEVIGIMEIEYDSAGDFKKLIKADIKTCISILEKWQE